MDRQLRTLVLGLLDAAILAVLLGCVLISILYLWGCAPAPPKTAAVQCATMGATLYDTSANCASQPSISRALAGERLAWDGQDYLVVNLGNEIRLWDLATHQVQSTSHFGVPNQGDSDYDLMAMALCDDCRYGAAWYKMGMVVFDLGAGSRPAFAAHTYYPGANATFGGIVYGTTLLTAALAGCPGTSGRYSLPDLALEECYPPGVQIAGGLQLGVVTYIVLPNTALEAWEGTAKLSRFGRAVPGKGTGYDLSEGLLVAASSLGAVLYDVSDPAAPYEVATIPGSYSRASLYDGVLALCLGGLAGTEHVYDVSDPAAPYEIGAEFWDPAEAWNHPGHACSSIQDMTVYEGRVYLARYSRLEVAAFGGCLAVPDLIFADGFESGNSSRWSGP